MGRKTIYIDSLVLFLLTAITILMTYPVVSCWTQSIIGDRVDSLLNAWILAWDVHKITSGEWLSIFHANIFYPHSNTLAYSEHMVGNALLALPILTIFNNPVLTYNLVSLIGFILSAFGMYLLVVHLTENRYGAFISALIFGFFPWRFDHGAHIQIQSSQWIPFTFLYLHRFFNDLSYKNTVLFSFFFILQFITSGYYGVYLALFVSLLILFVLLHRNIPFKPLILRLGLFVIFSTICIFPFYYPYIKVKQEMGFTRSLGEVIMYSPDFLNYLSTTGINRVWGKATQLFGRKEGLFLGITAILMGIAGIITVLKRKKIPPSQNHIQGNERTRIGLNILNKAISYLIVFYILVAWLVLVTGGFSTIVLGVAISATGLERPLWIILFLGGIKILIHWIRTGGLWTFGFSIHSPIPGFYLGMLFLSFVLSFGPIIHSHGNEIFQYSPYLFFYKYFPGFNGLRTPSRFIIMVVLSLSVLAGFGVKGILAKSNQASLKVFLTGILSILILVEYISIPIPMAAVPTGKDIPSVYQWLSNQKGDFPVLELPLPFGPRDVWIEAQRMYFSTYHWKKLVNGYSGYFPPDYDSLYQKGIKGFPSDDSIGLLRRRGIKFFIIHFDEYEKQDRKLVENLIKGYQDILQPVAHFKNDFVYELAGKP